MYWGPLHSISDILSQLQATYAVYAERASSNLMTSSPLTGQNEPMQITVIGTELPPQFIKDASEVPKPYAYQKLATSTHVFQ